MKTVGITALIAAVTIAGALAVTPTRVADVQLTTSSAVTPSAEATALLLCGTACPTWNAPHIQLIEKQFVRPTQPSGRSVDYKAVTTPSEAWPLNGALRVIGLLGLGEPGCTAPGGDCWPNQPLWKLSGLFDLTYDQSVQAGTKALKRAMAEADNDHLVIYGDSQGANVAVAMKRKLAERYPHGTVAPDINFVLTGDWNVPNGGLHARFPGLFMPIGYTFDGPEPTNTQFHTDVLIRQYDGAADFPLYPLNAIATLNALLGVIYVHPDPFDVGLDDPAAPPLSSETYGDTTYHLFETPDLPLFGPLRTLGVPEPVIDVVEPTFRALVETGYDRDIPTGQPTPAQLIPPAEVVTDLVTAVGKALDNVVAHDNVIAHDAPAILPSRSRPQASGLSAK